MTDPTSSGPTPLKGWIVFAAVVVAVLGLGLLFVSIMERRIEVAKG